MKRNSEIFRKAAECVKFRNKNSFRFVSSNTIFASSTKLQAMRTASQSNSNMSSLASLQSADSPYRYNDIRKSQEDTRNYRGLKLENGMRVLLVSDSTTDKSAACLCVEVGHMSDPNEIPGNFFSQFLSFTRKIHFISNHRPCALLRAHAFSGNRKVSRRERLQQLP